MDTFIIPGLFLLSGVTDTMCTQKLVYLGASNMRSMFSIFAYYFAQALVGLSPLKFSDKQTERSSSIDVEEAHSLVSDENKETDSVTIKKEILSGSVDNTILLSRLYFASAILDIMGYVIRTIGMVYCGSGLFQVAFSSVAIFSAIYSRIFLKTYITAIQWLGISIVTIGLVVSPMSTGSKGGSPLTGILMTLLGAQFYALSYIVNEYISRIPGNKGSKEICKRVGLINSAICLVVIIVDTIPNRASLIYNPIAAKKSSLNAVIMATATYIASHILHSFALYSVQGALGAIWTGLLQCIRACVVFIASGYFYCSTDPNQCLTISKEIAAVLVTIGIIIFNVGKQKVPMMFESYSEYDI